MHNRLNPSLVAVKKIQTDAPRDEHAPERLEALARAILVTGALVTPLLLKRTGIESFDLIGNPLHYWAAVRAKEIDVQAGEMVHCFILDDDRAIAALAQAGC